MPSPAGRRPIWSGTLAFGLVTLPVELHPTVRSSGRGLRMIGPDGVPLARRYYSEQRGEILEQDDIVRGYELDTGEFVVIEDEELEQLDPVRSRTIDLDMFVPREQLDPLLVNSTYLLVFQKDALPAYRLLVASMADSGMAGLASFVLRERAHHLAFTSDAGTLRALTLRYPAEIRSAAEVGLPEPSPADVDLFERFETAMRDLQAQEFDAEVMVDHEAELLQRLVNTKMRKGEDVFVTIGEADDPEESDGLTDIMVLLRQSLTADETQTQVSSIKG